MFFDPLSITVMVITMVISGIAQFMVKSAYKKYSQVPSSAGMSGAEAAARMLRANGIAGVDIEQVEGMLSDHYDPTKKVLRLSPDVYHGTSLASLGVACHEAGHALQHARGYTPLYLRSIMVPVATFGTNAGVWLMLIGVLMGAASGVPGIGRYMALIGFVAFLGAVLFSIVTLPVEFDASKRAKQQLAELGILHSVEEQRGVAKVLNAAAMTYVAAAIVSLLYLLEWAIRLGLIGGRRDD
ncbi:zinc metallopeptidase [bacterium]|nr:MAG: putative neutral zinc metallopeptidase [Candidatus Hinthialibacteria bacterium OLB16]MCK6495423.1 zinc metallopeptidase [bacterium]NUP91745.1 zinc metallopeptidase [Candidatus Omnitrophota bacterium]